MRLRYNDFANLKFHIQTMEPDEETQRMLEEMEAEFDRMNAALSQGEKDERFKRV